MELLHSCTKSSIYLFKGWGRTYIRYSVWQKPDSCCDATLLSPVALEIVVVTTPPSVAATLHYDKPQSYHDDGIVVVIWGTGVSCPACRTYEIATRFWVVAICPFIKCLIVLEFSFILFDLCLFITIFNFILNYVLIVTFWIFTYHKIWILLIIYCFIWNYLIIYFLTCLEVFWSVVS